MQNAIFISHASPEDNDFARWISLQLIGLGYEVWCDVLNLKGGEDWWPVIEKGIRDNTIKFLVVLSKDSNNKDGVLKELAVAGKAKKALNDSMFIIPLHIDSRLSYDDINVELIRLNSINFKNSWADGLKSLLELLEEQNVSKSAPDFSKTNMLWQTVFLYDKHPLDKEEIYYSNWFPIVEFPQVLRFHNFKYLIPKDFNINSLQYPAVSYKNYLVTFAWCYDFMSEIPKSEKYNKDDSVEIPVSEILDGSYSNKFISNREAKNFIIQILNKSFDKSIKAKPVEAYSMSNKTSFWIKQGILEKDKFNKVQLIGKQKDKHWHFGISGNTKLFPEKYFVINSHIWFTSDGSTIIPEASIQHSSRRKQGKNWWNNDWRNKTMAFMQFLAEPDETIHLAVGSEEKVKFSMNPEMFKSPVTYTDPNFANLPDDEGDFDLVFDEDTEIAPITIE